MLPCLLTPSTLLEHHWEAKPCREVRWKVRLLPTSSPTNWGCIDVNSGALEVSHPWECVCETGPFFLSREGFLVLLLFSCVFFSSCFILSCFWQPWHMLSLASRTCIYAFLSPKSFLISLPKVGEAGWSYYSHTSAERAVYLEGRACGSYWLENVNTFDWHVWNPVQLLMAPTLRRALWCYRSAGPQLVPAAFVPRM